MLKSLVFWPLHILCPGAGSCLSILVTCDAHLTVLAVYQERRESLGKLRRLASSAQGSLSQQLSGSACLHLQFRISFLLERNGKNSERKI